MKIIAVVGTGSGCGKTTVACRILRAVPGLGAVKISPRDGASRVEWGRGSAGKDTDLYGASGAVQVARIIGPREGVVSTWELIRSRFEGCRGVVIEGSSALGIPGERYVVFVAGKTGSDRREERSRALASMSEMITDGSAATSTELLVDAVRAFLAGHVPQ